MSKALLSMVLVLAVACGLYAGDGKKKVACVGDSITFGASIKDRKNNSYPCQLGKILGDGWTVRNFGVSGATLLKKGDKPYWKKRAYKNALNYKPNVVVIMLGTNDSKPINWKQKQDFVSDYVELVKSFQKLDSKPEVWVCLPVPAFPGKWGINEKTIGGEMMTMVKEVAKRTGAKIIDLHAALKTHGKLFPDTVHPNAEGAGLMAKAIAAEIARKK
jgi:lysophospholipase L1-like esterase